MNIFTRSSHYLGLKLVLTNLCILSINAVFAGAWVPDVGKGYHKLGFDSFNANDVFGGNPDFQRFDKEAIVYYGEFGIASDWALFYSIPYQNFSQQFADVETSSSGIGDVDIGLRYNWTTEPFVISTSFLFKAPFFYDEDEALPLGNGQEDYEFRIQLGKSLGKYGYYGVEAGYRFRADDPSDEFRYLLEYGASFNKNWYFRTKLDGLASANNASSFATQNFSITPEFDLGNLEVTTGWQFDSASENRWGIELTWTGAIYGDNILQGNNIQLALTYQH